MTTPASGDSRVPKNRRREAAREKAEQLREEQRRREVRGRVILISSLSVVAVAVVVGIALVITSSLRPAGSVPANTADDGIRIGEGFVAVAPPPLSTAASPTPSAADPGAVNISIYLDYMCPFCGQFEKTNSDRLSEWVDSGAATVEIHPLSILDRLSLGTRYSTRAANAAACVANSAPDQYWAFNGLLFTNQPAENTEGLDDGTLKSLAAEAGVADESAIGSCIDDKTFNGWVADSTSRALQGPLPGTDDQAVASTPTVLVNGQKYTGLPDDAESFSAFVTKVAGEAQNGSAVSGSTK